MSEPSLVQRQCKQECRREPDMQAPGGRRHPRGVCAGPPPSPQHTQGGTIRCSLPLTLRRRHGQAPTQTRLVAPAASCSISMKLFEVGSVFILSSCIINTKHQHWVLKICFERLEGFDNHVFRITMNILSPKRFQKYNTYLNKPRINYTLLVQHEPC